MPDSPLNQLLLPVGLMVNRVLALDPDAHQRLQALAGKSLAVYIEGFSEPLRVDFREDGLQLGLGEAEAVAVIHTTAGALIQLALSQGKGGTPKDLRFQGDVGFVQDVQRFFGQLHLDWEEPVAQVAGDLAAQQFGSAVRGLADWFMRSGEAFQLNASEYLTEESGLLPTAIEADNFFADVDRLRSDVDRLEARLKQLEKKR